MAINRALSPTLLVGPFVALVLLLVQSTECRAQLFGAQRDLGTPLSARQGTLLRRDDGPTIDGNERFVRGNRQQGEFVGGDRRDLRGFIGAEQAIGVGRVRSAVESLREFRDRSQSLNQPLQLPAKDEMYLPRLVMDFEVPPSANERRTQEVSFRLERLWEVTGRLPVEVSVEDRTAILRGKVPSAKIAEQLEILLSFEPGIDEIQNNLVFGDRAIVPPPPVRDR